MEAPLDAITKIVQEVHTEKTKHIFLSRHQNSCEMHKIKIKRK
jgi:hypothetical protein